MGATLAERRSFNWRDLKRADRISFLVVGIGIVVVNGILIGLLF